MFDVSQTDGEPLTDILDADLAVDKYDLITTALKGSVKGFEFGTSNDLDENTDALLDTDAKTITLREGLPQDKAMKTLINQIAAANVLMRDRRHFRGLNSYDMPNITAVEISSVSHSVGKHLGLEMPAVIPDFKYMSDENVGKFGDNVGVIRSVSQKMIAAVENAIKYQLQAEKEAKEKSEAVAAPAEPEIQDVKPIEQKVKKPTQAINSKTEAALC